MKTLGRRNFKATSVFIDFTYMLMFWKVQFRNKNKDLKLFWRKMVLGQRL